MQEAMEAKQRGWEGGGGGLRRRCGGKIFWKAKRVEKREEAEMGEGGGEASTGNVCGLNASRRPLPHSVCVSVAVNRAAWSAGEQIFPPFICMRER